jgi:hypothetical protein
VILVIGLVLAFALPRLEMTGEARLKSAARQLSGTLQSVFDQSVYQKKSFGVLYDLSNHSYQVILSPENADLSEAAASKWVALPDSVRFKDVSLESSEERFTEGKAITRFSPEGWAERTVIHLTDGKEDYTLILMPFSGKVKILAGYIETVEGEES